MVVIMYTARRSRNEIHTRVIGKRNDPQGILALYGFGSNCIIWTFQFCYVSAPTKPDTRFAYRRKTQERFWFFKVRCLITE